MMLQGAGGCGGLGESYYDINGDLIDILPEVYTPAVEIPGVGLPVETVQIDMPAPGSLMITGGIPGIDAGRVMAAGGARPYTGGAVESGITAFMNWITGKGAAPRNQVLQPGSGQPVQGGRPVQTASASMIPGLPNSYLAIAGVVGLAMIMVMKARR